MIPRSISILLLSASIHAVQAEIPNALQAPDGSITSSAEAWKQTVRPATLQKFRQEIYGTRPIGKPADFAAKVLREDPKALDGAATLREIEITYSGPNGKGAIHPLVITPNAATKPVPAFLLIHFRKPDPLDPKSANGDWTGSITWISRIRSGGKKKCRVISESVEESLRSGKRNILTNDQ